MYSSPLFCTFSSVSAVVTTVSTISTCTSQTIVRNSLFLLYNKGKYFTCKFAASLALYIVLENMLLKVHSHCYSLNSISNCLQLMIKIHVYLNMML